MTERANAYEKAHPRTRVPLVSVDVVWDGEGATRKAVCAAFDEAAAAGTPVLLYAGREKVLEGEKGTKAEVALARKFEEGPLKVEAAATASAGWALPGSTSRATPTARSWRRSA